MVHLYNSLSNSSLRQLIKWSSRVQEHLTHNLTVVTKEVFLEVGDFVELFRHFRPAPMTRVKSV